MLGRKKNIRSNAEWWAAWEGARELWPDERLQPLVDKTLEDMSTSLDGMAWGYGWSGGKDAQVISWLCNQLQPGAPGVLSTHSLHFPAMDEFHREFLPDGVSVVDTGQDLDWLAKHPERLFAGSAIHARTMRESNQHGQDVGFKAGKWDVLVTGRRTIDGNYTGPKGEHFYSNKRGITRYSPIHDWDHEAVLALIQRESILMAPCYGWPHGFFNGTEGWPFREGPDTIEGRLAEIHAIDSTILPRAAAYIPIIQRFIDQLKD